MSESKTQDLIERLCEVPMSLAIIFNDVMRAYSQKQRLKRIEFIGWIESFYFFLTFVILFLSDRCLISFLTCVANGCRGVNMMCHFVIKVVDWYLMLQQGVKFKHVVLIRFNIPLKSCNMCWCLYILHFVFVFRFLHRLM